ncbi:MAG: APC family permease [Gammaproteobacteria bacterium]
MKRRTDNPLHRPLLRRTLTLPLVTFYGLGNILGAGIYVLTGKVVAHAGMFAPLSFLVASLLAALSAFTYAELSARYPLSAGEAVYVQEGFGIELLSAVVGVLIIFAGIVSAATIVLGFTGYLRVFVPVPEVPADLALVLLLGGMAAWGISESVKAAALITLVEIAGLVLVIVVAVPGLAGTPPSLAETAWQGPETLYGIFTGAFLAFYAFIGFEDMVNVAEEVRQPRKNLPRALLLALGIASLLYFMVAFAAVGSIDTARLAASDAPLALIYQQATGREPVVITLIGMFAVINGALIQIIMAARVCYGMSARGWLPDWLGTVNRSTQTPVTATLLVSLAVLVMTIWLPLEALAKATSYFLLLVFFLVNLALWRLKRATAHPPGVLRIPAWVPACGFLVSLLFVAFQAVLDLAD